MYNVYVILVYIYIYVTIQILYLHSLPSNPHQKLLFQPGLHIRLWVSSLAVCCLEIIFPENNNRIFK